MRAYLGLRDTDAIYSQASEGDEGRLFGFPPGERNYARLRVA